MEQCFKIALWMLLVGCLQARPATKPPCKMDMEDLGFELLNEISCVSYTMIKTLYAALKHLKKELKKATNNCRDEADHISQTLEGLRKECLQQTNCNLTMTVHENFESFVDATKTIVQQFNDHQHSQDP
uniref:Uncharacterized protein n=1 Tax=Mola mola TaxID=94237 RepID=A0A3Q3VZV6_MOLML